MLVCVGGLRATKTDRHSNSNTGYISVWDVTTQRWRSLPSPPQPPLSQAQPYLHTERWGHSACVLPPLKAGEESQLYLIGGWDSTAQYADVYSYSLRTHSLRSIPVTTPQSSSNQLPLTPRAHHSAITCLDPSTSKPCIVVFGGALCEGGPYKYYNDVVVFDVASQCWWRPVVSGAVPCGRAQHSATLHTTASGEQWMVVVGGECGTEVLSATVFALHIGSWKWFELQCGSGSGGGGQALAPAGVKGLQPTPFKVMPARHSATRIVCAANASFLHVHRFNACSHFSHLIDGMVWSAAGVGEGVQ